METDIRSADSDQSRARVLRAATLTLVTAVAFWIFFQLTKRPELSAVSPFADDPVDAVGSFGFQIAILAAVLGLARAVRGRDTLALRADLMALTAITVTLVADGATEVLHPSWDASIWGRLLILGLAAVAFLTVLAGLALSNTLRQGNSLHLPAGDDAGALAESFGDVWAMVGMALSWLGRSITLLAALLAQIDRAGRAFLSRLDRLAWLSPRLHPWRFAVALATATGLALDVAHALIEGAPPSLAALLFVSAVYFVFEFVGVLSGFLVLGGFLGLRPRLKLWNGIRL